MTTLNTPAAIQFLIHCHTMVKPFSNQGFPFYRKLIPALIADNVIYRETPIGRWPRDQQVYRTTALGAAWIAALCKTPQPTVKTVYTDAQGVVLGEVK